MLPSKFKLLLDLGLGYDKPINMNGFKLTSEGNKDTLKENLQKAIEII